MRYLVYDEDKQLLRKFATKHEALYFIKERKELCLSVLPKVKIDQFGQALSQLGLALF